MHYYVFTQCIFQCFIQKICFRRSGHIYLCKIPHQTKLGILDSYIWYHPSSIWLQHFTIVSLHHGVAGAWIVCWGVRFSFDNAITVWLIITIVRSFIAVPAGREEKSFCTLPVNPLHHSPVPLKCAPLRSRCSYHSFLTFCRTCHPPIKPTIQRTH